MQWSPTERDIFVSCSVDCCIAIWDIRLGKKPAMSFKAHKADVNVVSWNRSLNLIRSVFLWCQCFMLVSLMTLFSTCLWLGWPLVCWHLEVMTGHFPFMTSDCFRTRYVCSVGGRISFTISLLSWEKIWTFFSFVVASVTLLWVNQNDDRKGGKKLVK